MAEGDFRDRTLALAGIAQAAELVQDLARTGKINQTYLEVCINTLFSFNVVSVAEVYGGIVNLKPGLSSLKTHFFHPRSPVQAEIMRYSFQLIQLGKKVMASSALSERLGEHLERIDPAQACGHDEPLIDEIADVYLKVISPVKPRVIVSGEQGYLAQKQTAAKVRVCLLGGVRSAHLWLQKGGGRLQLLTSRRAYQNQAVSVLEEMV